MVMDREKVISEFEDFVKSFSKRDDTYYNGLFVSVLAILKEQKSIIPWLSELMLNTNDEPIKPSEVIRRIEEGGLKRFAEEESQ